MKIFALLLLCVYLATPLCAEPANAKSGVGLYNLNEVESISDAKEDHFDIKTSVDIDTEILVSDFVVTVRGEGNDIDYYVGKRFEF